jgi:hypothetical protein
MFQNRHPGSSHNQMKGSANEYLDRLRDEFTQLHTQLQNSRMEIEKFSQEKEAVQRHYMMYYELACGLNVEWHKQVEVVKRLSGILNQIIPLLPPEHQASAIAAVERAKQINPQDLQSIMASQMQQPQLAMLPGMANMGSSLMGAGGPGGFHPAMAAMMSAAAGMKPEDAMALAFQQAKMPMMPQVGAPAVSGASAVASLSVPSATTPNAASVSAEPNSRAASAARARSSTPSGAGTPQMKRPKNEPDDEGDLEIDVQNDDIRSVASASHTNGTSQPGSSKQPKDGRESAQSASSRDSATPKSGRQQTTPAQSAMMPPADMGALLMNQGRFTGIFDQQAQRMLFPGLMPQANGKPAYSFHVKDGGQQMPTNFPADAMAGPNIPT